MLTLNGLRMCLNSPRSLRFSMTSALWKEIINAVNYCLKLWKWECVWMCPVFSYAFTAARIMTERNITRVTHAKRRGLQNFLVNCALITMSRARSWLRPKSWPYYKGCQNTLLFFALTFSLWNELVCEHKKTFVLELQYELSVIWRPWSSWPRTNTTRPNLAIFVTNLLAKMFIAWD